MRAVDAMRAGSDTLAALSEQIHSHKDDPAFTNYMLESALSPDLRFVLWRPQLWRAATNGAEAFSGQSIILEKPELALWLFDEPPCVPACILSELDILEPTLQGVLTVPIPAENTPDRTPAIAWMIVFLAGQTVPGEPAPRVQTLYSWTETEQSIPEGYEFCAAAGSFLVQPFCAVEPLAPANRAERKQIERLQHKPEVSVVCLRRKAPGKREREESAPAEWTCSWAVRSHWRRPSPLMKEPRPVYVHGYVKGDLDKPFRTTAHLAVVSR